MGFVQLNELYFKEGYYRTKPLLCNVDEIANVEQYDYKGYVESRTIYMKGGKVFSVTDKYDDIVRMISEVSDSKNGDDNK